MKIRWQKKILLSAAALYAIIVIIGIVILGEKKQMNVWHVEQGLENKWARILREGNHPNHFIQIKTWDGSSIPSEAGILIATNPWRQKEKAAVFPLLSLEMEYNGAIVLALDPWMIFRKHMNPIPSPEEIKMKLEKKSIKYNCFSSENIAYNQHAALYKLLGSENSWLYAPLSAVRFYNDPQKSLLEATPYPREDGKLSLQAKILWALPTGADKNKEKLAQTIDWLKSAATQTIIADTLKWIPAAPYGQPYDPVSLSSHRAWLSSEQVYTPVCEK